MYKVTRRYKTAVNHCLWLFEYFARRDGLHHSFDHYDDMIFMSIKLQLLQRGVVTLTEDQMIMMCMIMDYVVCRLLNEQVTLGDRERSFYRTCEQFQRRYGKPNVHPHDAWVTAKKFSPVVVS